MPFVLSRRQRDVDVPAQIGERARVVLVDRREPGEPAVFDGAAELAGVYGTRSSRPSHELDVGPIVSRTARTRRASSCQPLCTPTTMFSPLVALPELELRRFDQLVAETTVRRACRTRQ